MVASDALTALFSFDEVVFEEVDFVWYLLDLKVGRQLSTISICFSILVGFGSTLIELLQVLGELI